MSEYVDTTITFTGDSASLTDLFSKLQIGWLGDIADVFGVQAHCSGSIEDIDTEYHTIYQITRWETNTELWEQIISKRYKDAISFVYRSVEPCSGVFINSDISHDIYPDKYFCDFEVGDSADTVYYAFDEEQLFLELIRRLTAQTVQSFEEAKSICDSFNSSHCNEFIHIGTFEPD